VSLDDNDFKTFRRYSRRDAANLLHVPDSWLKNWVTNNAVPHQRSGKPGPRQRGVWFTYGDILAIGEMMPSLMTTRQANSRAEGQLDGAPNRLPGERPLSLAGGEDVPPANSVSDDAWQAFANLSSLRA
jgi:hypothetical protein